MSKVTTRRGTKGRKMSRDRRHWRHAERPTLTRDRLITESLVLLDREGPDAFSLRRLADHLGVTPMAVYNHVSSKQDLLLAIADAVVGRVVYRRVRGDWQKVLTACFQTLRQACLAHPGAMPLIESAETLPAAVFRPMEITLTTLQGIGFDSEDAMRAYSLLITFTLGQASYQIKGWARGVDSTAAVRDGRISAETFPAVVKSARSASWDFDRVFEFGLSVVLAGLNAKLHQR
jgi:TetR/AcrR family tetracycline transcriptional repressor